VANDLKVQFSRAPRDDSDIARAIAHILEWNAQIPEGKVHARVENGWVRSGLPSPSSCPSRSGWLISSSRSGQVAWPAAGSARISSPSRSCWSQAAAR
jgi:hypothetical protein